MVAELSLQSQFKFQTVESKTPLLNSKSQLETTTTTSHSMHSVETMKTTKATGQTSPVRMEQAMAIYNNDMFKPKYLRNNKGGGMKNLRCFPRCSDKHQERGFCGTNVVIQFQIPSSLFHGDISRSNTEHTFRFYSEFVRLKDTDKPPLTPGQTKFTGKDMRGMERTPKTPTNPWFKGSILDIASSPNSAYVTVSVSFNEEKRAWHYGWNSNKHTCRDDHSLRCYLFSEITAMKPTCSRRPEDRTDMFVLDNVFDSPHFTIHCKKREKKSSKAKTQTIPTKQVTPTHSNKRRKQQTNPAFDPSFSPKRHCKVDGRAVKRDPDLSSSSSTSSTISTSSCSTFDNQHSYTADPRSEYSQYCTPPIHPRSWQSNSKQQHILQRQSLREPSDFGNWDRYRPPAPELSLEIPGFDGDFFDGDMDLGFVDQYSNAMLGNRRSSFGNPSAFWTQVDEVTPPVGAFF